MPEKKQQIYSFDNFRIDVLNRELRRDGSTVALPAKAFDMLVVLIENGGRLLGKDELFSRVWPDQIVEESNLTVQVSAIRKALGERRENPHYIITVPGHGYRFVGDLLSLAEDEEEVMIEHHSRTRILVEMETESDHLSDPVNGDEETATGKSETTIAQFAVPGSELRAADSLGRHRQVKARAKMPAAVLLLAAFLGVALFAGLYRWRGGGQSRTQVFLRPIITKLPATFNVRDAALSPDGNYVLYLRSDEGIKSIWLGLINASSSVLVSQTFDADMYGLTFAPDGSSFYYILIEEDYRRQTLFRMPVTGGVPKEILTEISSPITFSPDGRRLAFVRQQRAGEKSELVIAGAEDGSEQRVVTTRYRPESFSPSGPAWSPDGETIALGEKNSAANPYMQLTAISVETGASKPLTEKTWNEVGRVAWLAKGGGLVFIAREPNSAWISQLWFLAQPGDAARAITNDVVTYDSNRLSRAADGSSILALQLQNNYQLYLAPKGDPTRARKIDMGAAAQQFPLFDPTFVPDGRIVYGVVSGESRALWMMGADGGNRRQITLDGEVARYPSVTADGRHIVYQSTRAGRTDIWRVGVDGSHPEQLTNDGVSYHPHCSPDGTWVAYVSARAGEERIWRVATDGGETLRLTDKRSNWPRVSPDGRWIACSLFDPEKEGRAQLIVIAAGGGPPLKTFSLTKTGTFNDGVRWSSDGSSLIFRDYRFGVWLQPLNGGPPQPLKSFAKLKIYDMDWSPDGEQMAYTSGAQARVVTLIRGFR